MGSRARIGFTDELVGKAVWHVDLAPRAPRGSGPPAPAPARAVGWPAWLRAAEGLSDRMGWIADRRVARLESLNPVLAAVEGPHAKLTEDGPMVRRLLTMKGARHPDRKARRLQEKGRVSPGREERVEKQRSFRR